MEHLCNELAKEVKSGRTKFWFHMQEKVFYGKMEVFYEGRAHIYEARWDVLSSERANPTAFNDAMKNVESLEKIFSNRNRDGPCCY